MAHDPYTRERFAADLRALQLSRVQFAAAVGLDRVTVYHWGYLGTPFPVWVPMLLGAWVALRAAGVRELPGIACDG